jgi:hypothetical protein
MILLAENRFLQVGKGAENTKEKSRHCFTCRVTPKDLGVPKVSPHPREREPRGAY